MSQLLKSHFPFRVVAYDADGVQRNVSHLSDIVALAEEKAERYNDSESKRFVYDVQKATTRREQPVEDKKPAPATKTATPPATKTAAKDKKKASAGGKKKKK